MPVQHRVGEQKRYHYSGSSAGRYSPSQAGPATGRGSGRVPYSSGEMGLPSSAQETGGGTPGGSDSGNGSPSQYFAPRHSRYESSSFGNNRSSVGSRPGSRFNPDAAATPTGVPSGSRWAGSHSRYNSQTTTTPASTSYRGPVSSAVPNGQHAPLPASSPVVGSSNTSYYPASSASPTHVAGHSPYSYGVGRSQRPRSSFDSFSSGSPQDDGYESKTFGPNKPLKSGSFWSSRNVRGGKHYSGSRYNGFKKYPNKYNTNDMLEMPKSKRPIDSSHSLGSSLINSVPQTTRKVEEQAHHDHKRLDVSANEYTNDQEGKSFTHQKDISDYIKSSEQQIEEKTSFQTDSHLDRKAEKPLVLPEPKAEFAKDDKSGSKESSMVPVDLEESSLVSEETKSHEKEEDMDIDRKYEHGKEAEVDEDIAEELNTIQESTGPLVEKSHIPSTSVLPKPEPYPEPLHPINGCIFPMQEPQMKLWLLKNKSREEIIKDQKYLLKKPVEYLFEYPFFIQTWIIHKQATRPVMMENIAKIKRYEYLRKLQLKDQFFKLEAEWIKKCDKMAKVSESCKRSANDDAGSKDAVVQQPHEKPKEVDEQRPSSSRRRNRADFVDDSDIENVLLQIDPDYKHHQLAAAIPPMELNPIKKNAYQFKDVNNLVTDKDKWASRILTDRVDNFTAHEHELFVEGYLAYPKRFGKISHHMGGLRTPEECVLHYYRTKKKTKYKKLLLEKNKKRKASVGRKRKEKSDSKRKELEEEKSEQPVDMQPETSSVSLSVDVVTRTEEKPPRLSSPKAERIVADAEVTALEKENKKDSDTETETEATAEGDAIDNVDPERVDRKSQAMPKQNRLKVSAIMNEVPVTSTSVSDNMATNDRSETEAAGAVLTQISTMAAEQVDNVTVDISGSSQKHPLSEQDAGASVDHPNKKKLKASEAHKSSYWSVQEAKKFPLLLKEFGSNWSAISEKLGTKSTTMVKNYFQRKAGPNSWYSLVDMANSQTLSESPIVSSSEPSGKPVAIAPAPNVTPISTPEAGSNAPMGKPVLGSLPLQTIPPQQKPAVGFFSDSKLPAIQSSSFSMGVAEESFSRLPTPTQGLPVQHMPMISSFNVQHNAPKSSGSVLSDTAVPKPRTPSVHFATNVPEVYHSTSQPHTVASSRRSSIRSLLNDGEDSETQSNTMSNASPPSVHAAAQGPGPIVRQSTSVSNPISPGSAAPSRATEPAATNVIVQELSQTQLNHKPTIALPHASNILPPLTAMSAAASSAVPPSINFANDPLAALAAVASSSEAFGLMPSPNNQAQSQPNIRTNANPRRC